MDKPCDICGDFGYREVLLTCCKCKVACEHVYCMRIHLQEVPEDWVCDSCLMGGTVLAKGGGDIVPAVYRGKNLDGFSWQVNCRKQRAIQTGKVKFIPKEEVIKLSSGAPSTSYMKFVARRTPIVFKPTSPEYAPFMVNACPRAVHSGRGKPPKNTDVQIQSTQQPPQGSKLWKEKWSILAPMKANAKTKQSTDVVLSPRGAETSNTMTEIRKRLSVRTAALPEGRNHPIISSAIKEERAWEKQPINALVPRRGMQTTDMDTKKAVNKALCSLTDRAIKEEHAWEKQPINALVPHRGVQTTDMDTKKAVNKALCSLTDRGNMIYAIPEDRHFDDEERDMLSVFPKVNLYRPYFPALHPTWKGGFVFYDTATAGKFYGDFQAQPPCRVHRKAYEFSQKLPPVLQVKLFPESHFWEDVCQNDCLDLHDIALYFFPSDNVERSRQNNSWLLDRMEFENSIMRSSFNGVELLILTSKQLHEDSKKITSMFIGECFLLGVFCPAKIDQALHSNQPSEVSPSECAHDYHTNRDEIKAVNMETDKKLDGNSRCISKELGSTIQPLLSEFKPQRPKDSTDFTMISKRIKTEVDSNLPPGFKKRLG